METDSDPVDHRGVKAWGGGAGSLQRLKAGGWQRDEGPAQSDCPVLWPVPGCDRGKVE